MIKCTRRKIKSQMAKYQEVAQLSLAKFFAVMAATDQNVPDKRNLCCVSNVI